MNRCVAKVMDVNCACCGSVFETTRSSKKYCNGCWLIMERLRRTVHSIVLKAKNDGHIPPPNDFKCNDCGKRAQQYDHRDYARPLHLDPVCMECNKARGPANRMPKVEDMRRMFDGRLLEPYENRSLFETMDIKVSGAKHALKIIMEERRS